MFFFGLLIVFFFSHVKTEELYFHWNTLLHACPNLTSFFLEIILKLFIHQEQCMLHPISLSFSFPQYIHLPEVCGSRLLEIFADP